MRLRLVIAVAVLALAVLAALGLGLDDWLARQTVLLQRDYQNALGRALRGLRAGEPGAVAAFLGICFAYGFLHALGPGHGKAVIGAYGVASAAPLRRMVCLALLSSLAQAGTAIAVVYAGVWLWGGARERVEGLAGRIEPLGALAIALLGAILLWRGLRHVLAGRGHVHHDHDHDHHHGPDCGCGHAHAPNAEQVAAARSWREMAALVAAVALRPCTGALFLLILTWRFGLDGLGVLGALVMGLGTFMVTGLAAALAVGLRRGVALSLPGGRHAPLLAALIEVAVGGVVLVLALSVALRLM